jgi:antitoxin FitA
VSIFSLTCLAHALYNCSMKSNIQIKSVPSGIHKKLKEKASLAGLSLTEFLMQELKLIAERPTVDELKERLLSRKPVKTSMSPSKVLRAERIKK